MSFEKYGLIWNDGTHPIEIERQMIRRGGQWTGQHGTYGNGLYFHYLEMRRLVWPHRYRHEWTELIYRQILDNQMTFFMGAASCIAGHTKLLNPLTGSETPVKEFYDKQIRPVVMTLDGPELAEIPFIKGRADLFEVTLETGKRFTVTANHRVFTETGFVRVASLTCGQRILAYVDNLPVSKVDTSPSMSLEDASHLWKTTPDFQADCLNSFHFCDEPLHPILETDADEIPSPNGVHTHPSCILNNAGVSALKYAHSHANQRAYHLSSCNGLFPVWNKETFFPHHFFSKSFEHGDDLFLQLPQSLSRTRQRSPFSRQDSDCAHNLMGYEMPCDKYRVQHEVIASIKFVGNDFYYDLEVPRAHHYFAEGAIHHNTQKTSHISEWVLLKYWCFPENCCVLVSTVNKEKLEMSIFGEIKSLWESGRNTYPNLAGHLIDYKNCITTADIEEDDVRDLRKGIIGKPCFPTGTLIDTPNGKVPIESIQPGDLVINAIGVGRVKKCSVTFSQKLVRIHFKDSRTVDCTEEHPFFTQRGWVNAVDVRQSDRVFSPDEALQILQQGNAESTSQSDFLFNRMPGQKNLEKLSPLQKNILCGPNPRNFLQSTLRREINYSTTRHEGSCFQKSGYSNDGQTIEENNSFQSKGTATPVVNDAINEPKYAGWRNNSRINVITGISRSRSQFQNPKTGQSCQQFIACLPNRFGISENQISSRIGRTLSSPTKDNSSRQKPHKILTGAWVDRVEILQSHSDDRYSGSRGGYQVHNLEVDGHPSYSVENFLVHNCYVGRNYVGLGVFAGIKQEHFVFVCDELQFMAPTFLDCLPNMLSNTGSGGLKVIGSGNPKHDPEDQLAIACEPADGWTSVENITKTAVWKTKYGVCVNLIGTDSPNFRAPIDKPEPFPRLIGRQFAKDIARIWGENSPEYEKQVMGRMKLSLSACRVITRQLCREHDAQAEIIWAGSDPLTRIYTIDPAYGGGDRCVCGYIEFGKAMSGKIMLKIIPPRVLQINLKDPATPEMQIARHVKADLEAFNITPQNCFYDSFGKGTIGFAFAQTFGANCPIPINAGDKPSHRIVQEGLYVEEKSGSKRLKRCDEHYSKFITEMWFSVRYAIEANQVGELTEEIIREGCMREYREVAGNKLEVEPKDDMRERLGKSPDLFDWCALAVEGARQRGFIINKLGAQIAAKRDKDWLDKQFDGYQKLVDSNRLTVLS